MKTGFTRNSADRYSLARLQDWRNSVLTLPLEKLSDEDQEWIKKRSK